jgi:hypothetical protein
MGFLIIVPYLLQKVSEITPEAKKAAGFLTSVPSCRKIPVNVSSLNILQCCPDTHAQDSGSRALKSRNLPWSEQSSCLRDERLAFPEDRWGDRGFPCPEGDRE